MNKKRSSFTLEKDLSGSANLLLLTNYIVESSYLGSNAVPISRSMDAALSSLLEEYANNFLPPTSEELLVRRRLENESQLENELKDLVNAVGMLRSEVAIASDENRSFEHALSVGNIY